jgi:ABC-type nitrate/sulfonate/bicarbonate transport system substrate-binding protein
VGNLTFDFSRVLHALMSRPEIPNAAALKGKIVGVSSFGATGDLAARVGLRSLGLDLEKDHPRPRHPARCRARGRHSASDAYAGAAEYSA